MSTQPILPSPVAPSDLEKAYIEDEPSGLFPQNQDSNFGLYRKIFSDTMQDAVNQIDLLYNERFPETSVQFLNYWEEQVGLPQNPPGLSLTARQGAVGNRLKKGYFTRALRASIVAQFVSATFGSAPAFGTLGIPIGTGIPLYAGITSSTASQYYKIVEDIPNFKYSVYFDSRIVVDLVALLRELTRVTPAGLKIEIINWYQKSGGAISVVKGGGTHA